MIANGLAGLQQSQVAGDAAASVNGAQRTTLLQQQADLATLQDGSNDSGEVRAGPLHAA